ncbi:MAG: serine--tRNA ligase [Candidatus Margulisiibacteriota bacterium]
MLDPKAIRANPQQVRESLEKRGAPAALLESFLEADSAWRTKTQEYENLKSRQNQETEKISLLKREKKDASSALNSMKELSQRLKLISEELKLLEERVVDRALVIPNILEASVPVGKDSTFNSEIRKWGQIKEFQFKPKPHEETGERLGLFNFEQAAKLSGSRFVVLKGAGAALEMALINFMLEVHTGSHGYEQVMTPFLVNADSMKATGQLPKFEDELYKTSDDLYLIPTAEVSVTNLHRNEVIAAESLPLKYVSFSPCFRREAGSYGKDVKGIIRQHQFNKIELVKFCLPETSPQELESLTNDAEKILQLLELPYRVMALAGGDVGFSAAKTYDLEVWFPSEKRYREISSCSNFTDFQARRGGIRLRRGPKAKPEFVHTLNGSGLAVGRTLAAILENYQQEDGSVKVPEALQKFLQVSSIKPR